MQNWAVNDTIDRILRVKELWKKGRSLENAPFLRSSFFRLASLLYFTLPGIACFRASGKVAATIK